MGGKSSIRKSHRLVPTMCSLPSLWRNTKLTQSQPKPYRSVGQGVLRKWQKKLLVSWLIYIAIGRLLVWTFMQFPFPNFLEKIKPIKKLHECDFCAGVWGYTFLAFFMRSEER